MSCGKIKLTMPQIKNILIKRKDEEGDQPMMQPIPFEEFLSRTGIDKGLLFFINHRQVKRIVSLKSMQKIITLVVMPKDYLCKLLSCITLSGSPKIRVYTDSRVNLMKFDPAQLLLGQKYIYRNKYIAIFENFNSLFKNFFVTNGISKLVPHIALGEDKDGEFSMAHYITPIVERHNNKLILMDGIHRNFIVKRVGTTIESIFLDDVRVPFPCSAKPWEETELIDCKPEKQEDRFFDLRPELFRNLEAVGIDG